MVQLGNDFNGEAAGDQSGYSVRLTSDVSLLAVGAIYNNGSGSDAGHVRVLNVCLPTGAPCNDDILCTINEMTDNNCNFVGIPVSQVSDIIMNGITNTSDLLVLLGSFGQLCLCPQDLNNDGTISTIDVLYLLGQFGLNCPGAIQD